MLTIKRTERFQHWYLQLRDGLARQRILARITQARQGNCGDCRSVGDGVFEMRIHVEPGYRVYLTRIAGEMVILIAGGDMSTQTHDIFFAKRLAKSIRRTYEGRN